MFCPGIGKFMEQEFAHPFIGAAELRHKSYGNRKHALISLDFS